MRPALLVWLVLAGFARAEPPRIEVPAEVRPSGQYVAFVPGTDADSVVYVGLDGLDPIPSALLRDPRQFLLDTYGKAPGRYRFAAVAAKGGEQARADFSVVIGDPPPGPGPGPGPEPGPGPGPQPGPAPIPLPGLRVLIVYESAEANRLPAGQQEILFGREVRQYLEANTATGPDGRTKEYRIWDRNVPLAHALPHWRDAMARGQKSVPWLVVSNGKAGYEGPLPATAAEFKALVDRYKGQ